MKIFLWVVVIIAAIVAGGMWYLGMFQKVAVTCEELGPFRMIYMEHKGSYQGIGSKIKEVKSYVDSRKIVSSIGIGEYFDDPAKVRPAELRSNVGFLVDRDYGDDPPYRFKNIPRQVYASAVFKGSPMIGPIKVYPELKKWIDNNGYEVCGSCMELYAMEGKKVFTQYLMPIKKKQ